MEPPATKRLWPVRVGLAALLALYLGYSSFGIAHPVLWGHMGHHEAEYMMRVRTTFRQHLVTPATHAGYDVPPWNDYYFHHPIGYHHVLGAWTLLLGDHLWTPTTLPVATGLLLIWALFALVRIRMRESLIGEHRDKFEPMPQQGSQAGLELDPRGPENEKAAA